MVGRQVIQHNGRSVFVACFGISPKTCAVTWFLLHTVVGIDNIYRPCHFLWTLYFLKNYTTEEVTRTFCGNPSNKNLREKIWSIIEKISKLGDTVIVFDRRLEGSTPYRAKMTVDGTDFKIRQQTLKSKEIQALTREERYDYFKSWYCYKFKSSGVRYEVGVCIVTGNICWINGPFQPGIFNDIKIFQRDLKHRLLVGEQVIADQGYRGEPLFARIPDEQLDTPEETFFNQRARARQENVNRFFKNWKCLSQTFRHDVKKHCVIFWSVAILTQISFDMNENLNYQVEFVGETVEQAREYLGNTI